MAKIYHKDHGFVITTDQVQINELLAKGGELVDKCSEYGNEKTEETTKTEILEEKPQGDSLENIEFNISKSQSKRMKHQRYGDK